MTDILGWLLCAQNSFTKDIMEKLLHGADHYEWWMIKFLPKFLPHQVHVERASCFLSSAFAFPKHRISQLSSPIEMSRIHILFSMLRITIWIYLKDQKKTQHRRAHSGVRVHQIIWDRSRGRKRELSARLFNKFYSARENVKHGHNFAAAAASFVFGATGNYCYYASGRQTCH